LIQVSARQSDMDQPYLFRPCYEAFPKAYHICLVLKAIHSENFIEICPLYFTS